jgi:hypothetical protein
MPIDANIPLQVKPFNIQLPVNQLAAVSEAMKIGEMNRGIETQNKLRDLYSQGVDVSTPEGFKQVASIDPATALKLRTDALKGQELLGNIKKTGVETKLRELDVQREQFGNLVFNPSNANVTAHIEDSVLKGNIPPAQAQALLAQVMPMNADQRKQFFTDMAVKAETRFQGDITKRGQDISASTTMRGQNLTDARAREGQALQYGPDVVANTVTDAAGNVTQFNRQGQVIGKPGAVGKPSATFEKTAALQKQQGKDLSLAITELTEATKDGGLIDKSTGSGAGRLVDVAAGFAGQATPGAIAIAKLKPIADIALKMVPRFEGPQSDKDTASYKEAAGQLADASLPTEIRKQAGREVLRLMKARKGQFVNEAMAAEGIGAGTPALPPGFTPDK